LEINDLVKVSTIGSKLGETEMATYQNVKEVQFVEGEYSIIFSGGLMADPKTISAVRD